MTVNKVFTPFAFYSDILLQNRFKPRCKNDCISGLVSPNNRFLAFQFRRPSTGQSVTAFELYDLNDALILSIPTYYIQSFATSEYDYFIYAGHNLSAELDCGEYYLKVTTGTRSYFSEVFEVKKFEQYFEPFNNGITFNGGFETTDYWNVNNGTTQWTIAGNVASHFADGSLNVLDYLHFNHVSGSEIKFPIQIGKTIRVRFTLVRNAGTLRLTTRNTLAAQQSFTASGDYDVTITVVNNVLRFVGEATFNGDISNLVVTVVEDFENCDKIYLNWLNTCDIYNIKFSRFNNINSTPGFDNIYIYNGYKNEVFLETEIGEPEYRSFQEEVEDNEFNKIATFKKDSKWYKLTGVGIAEFLVDGFSVLNRFDTIRIYDPYKDELHQVMELEWLNEWLFDACFAQVNLTWKDFDLIADACCDEVVAVPCIECSEEIFEFWLDHDLPDPELYEEGSIIFVPANQPIERYWFASTDIYKLIGGVWVLQANPAIYTLYCFANDPYEESPFIPDGQYMYLGDGTWIRFPFIYANINPDNICQLIINSFVLPGMTVEIFVNLNGGGYNSIGSYNSLEMANGVILTSTQTTSFSYEIKATIKTLNCDYGETPEIEAGGGGGSPSCQFVFINYP